MIPELEKKVAAVLPAGEALVGAFRVERTEEGDGSVPRRRRPKVLGGRGGVGDVVARFFRFFYCVVTTDVPALQIPTVSDDPAQRERRQRKKGLFFGTWEGMAGRWMAAGQPRCMPGVNTVVAVTEGHLRFVYVQCARLSGKLGAVETGAVFRRGDLVWTRRHNTAGDMQFGFADGSWATLTVPGFQDLVRVFPGTLAPKDPIP
ncbi:hypothetical protein [Streptomyces sp. NPDC059788]|uniref:hypothetical protein n=1 Tax=Streptomyces sp. NPDC059788 TaxID=3346948 RepID=UPI00365A5B61